MVSFRKPQFSLLLNTILSNWWLVVQAEQWTTVLWVWASVSSGAGVGAGVGITTPPKNDTHTTPTKNNTHTTTLTQEQHTPRLPRTTHTPRYTKTKTHTPMLIFLIVVAMVSAATTFWKKKKTRSVRSCFFFFFQKWARVEVALFRPDTNARSMLIRAHTHLHHLGNRNHRAEPVPVLRRAPTLSDEQRQQRVGLRALPPSEHLPKCANKRDPGKAKDSTFQGPSSCPRESPITVFHTVKPGKNQQTPYLAPRSANQDVPLDDGWRSIDQDRQCCRIVKTVKPQRTPESVREVLEQDQRIHCFDLKSSTDSTLCFVFTCPAWKARS